MLNTFGNKNLSSKIQIETETNNEDQTTQTKKEEGKKYIMKSLQMENEFESFYSHGEACLVGERFFGT
jgi:hypothetical protein